LQEAELEMRISNQTLPETPIIVEISGSGDRNFVIVVERVTTVVGISSWDEALCLCFVAYFNLGLAYNDELSGILAFIET
jgi:hypothetical protein